MKQLALYKSVDHIQLGHLYEHLYCMNVVKNLRNKGLFTLVDYYIDAKTHYSGFLSIDAELYTDEAIRNSQLFDHTPTEITTKHIRGAIQQICSEKKAEVVLYLDNEAVTKLRQYDTSDWLSHEPNTIASQEKVDDTIFNLKTVSSHHFTNLVQKIEYRFSKSDSVDVELFKIISLALRSNLQEDISDTTYCFTYKDTFKISKDKLSDINYYRLNTRQVTTLTTEILTAKKLIESMITNGFISRLTTYIQDSPNSALALTQQANIENILKSTTITFSLGLMSKQFSLKEFFK